MKLTIVSASAFILSSVVWVVGEMVLQPISCMEKTLTHSLGNEFKMSDLFQQSVNQKITSLDLYPAITKSTSTLPLAR